MKRQTLAVMGSMLLALLSACAGTSVRVRCDAHLQPINPMVATRSSSPLPAPGAKAP
jgi:hypothetical protein